MIAALSANGDTCRFATIDLQGGLHHVIGMITRVVDDAQSMAALSNDKSATEARNNQKEDMNNLNYNSQDAATVGPKVEEKVREEFGGSDPIPYEIETGDAATASVRTVLGDMAAGLFGGKEKSLFRMVFQFTTPRPAQLIANVARIGVGSHVGLLIYSAVLAKSVSGEVALEGPKMFGKSKFTGDPSSAARLNANGQLLKAAADLARLESPIAAGQTVKIERYCVVKPHESGSILIVHTLPRPIKMGFNATVDAKEFFELVSLVEAAL